MKDQMFVRAPFTRIHSHSSRLVIDYVLPFGWLALLTGMFWIGARDSYHQIFYVLIAAPTFFLVLLNPRQIKGMVSNPLFLAFLLFAAYMTLSLFWSAPSDSPSSLAKRPFYIIMLLFSAGFVTCYQHRRMEQVVLLSAVIAVVSAALSLAFFISQGPPLGSGNRLTGYGALYNPLLTAHVYGAFTSIWLAKWFLAKSPLAPLPLAALAILGCLIIATGSRTPLTGLIAATAWLFLCGDKRRGMLAIVAGVTALILVAYCYPELLLQRGVSSRPDIWIDSIRQISEAPWFGHGYGHPIIIIVPGLEGSLADPHNILLGVLYAGGVVGLLLWLGMYTYALFFAWQERRVPMVLLTSSWLVFGFVAGMTEGMAFMSRPKEHWFLIWFPLVLIYAQWLQRQWVVCLNAKEEGAQSPAASCHSST